MAECSNNLDPVWQRQDGYQGDEECFSHRVKSTFYTMFIIDMIYQYCYIPLMIAIMVN